MSVITVLSISSEGQLILDEEKLKKILLNPLAENKYAVVISVTGLLRKGKSTLLNFIKCYLDNEWPEIENSNKQLNGFIAMQGSDPVTEGIVMWSEPIIKTINDEEVAVYLIDTEGTHETGSEYSANSALFVLTGLVSSIQIFNVISTIDQRDFEIMAQFGQFAEEISKKQHSDKSFQKLVVLIRDWVSPYDIEYGPVSLQKLLDKTSRKHKSKNWLTIYNEIDQAYNKIICYLMPFPGEKIAFCTNRNKTEFYFNDFKENFIFQLKLLIGDIFSNNIIKKADGDKVKSFELFNMFKEYYEVFKTGSVVSPDSVFKANAKLGYERAYEEAYKYYMSEINSILNDRGILVSKKGTEEKMKKISEEAKSIFINKKPTAYQELSGHYIEKLIENVEEFNDATLKRVENLVKWRDATVTGVAFGATLGAGLCEPTVDVRNDFAEGFSVPITTSRAVSIVIEFFDTEAGAKLMTDIKEKINVFR